ncbi:MAG: 16S rRNA (cytidine(1402)-2'-O)-methyltransferase [Bdellovibrionota bacterium]
MVRGAGVRSVHPSGGRGRLDVVATPIGNLGDLSPRAQSVLADADLILAEDTRSFKRLPVNLKESAQVLSYYDHNEQQRIPQVLDALGQGKNVALVSEAGTPLVSDPGYRLVRACREHNYPVSPIPGPCAAISALSVSGLPSDRFIFEGFLPVKEGKKRKALASALERGITALFYESPHRIAKTLALIEDLAPDCEVFVARELTKLHEETFFGTAAEVAGQIRERTSLKGEVVLAISGKHATVSHSAGELDDPTDEDGADLTDAGCEDSPTDPTEPDEA